MHSDLICVVILAYSVYIVRSKRYSWGGKTPASVRETSTAMPYIYIFPVIHRAIQNSVYWLYPAYTNHNSKTMALNL